jgi:hypothetical protein
MRVELRGAVEILDRNVGPDENGHRDAPFAREV